MTYVRALSVLSGASLQSFAKLCPSVKKLQLAAIDKIDSLLNYAILSSLLNWQIVRIIIKL